MDARLQKIIVFGGKKRDFLRRKHDFSRKSAILSQKNFGNHFPEAKALFLILLFLASTTAKMRETHFGAKSESVLKAKMR